MSELKGAVAVLRRWHGTSSATVVKLHASDRNESDEDEAVHDRALGSYLGLAIGDALGATVEFMTAREIQATFGVHRSILGGGWLSLKPGQVTDDTQMSIALGGAILSERGWKLPAVAEAFVAWMRRRPPDIGNTCRRGIRRYMQTGALCGRPAEEEAGNGAAMRNLPVVLAALQDLDAMENWSLEQAHITHCNALSDAATLTLARSTRSLLLGGGIEDVRREAETLVRRFPTFRYDPWPGQTSGYIVDTLQTVFEALFATDNFEDCLVRVVNRGGDADTTGALAGQLAGALYGASAIPKRWLKRLDSEVRATVEDQTEGLLRLSLGEPLALPDDQSRRSATNSTQVKRRPSFPTGRPVAAA